MNQYRAYYECDYDLTQYLTLRINANSMSEAHAEAINRGEELSNAYAVEIDLINVEPIETR